MKNIIVFINSISKESLKEIKAYQTKKHKTFRILVLRDKQKNDWKDVATRRGVLYVTCNIQRASSLKKVLGPYQQDIIGVVARGEVNVGVLRNVIPHVPYSVAPTESSLDWATNKLQMREQLMAYDAAICPKFTIVSDDSEKSLQKISKKVGYPLVIKPTNLALSLLVSICFHENELEQTLKKVFRKIKKIYKDNKRTDLPTVLVEEFMEGEMYSVDGYVNATGAITWCPLVHVKTGRSIGFDDFFGYQQITPTTLKDSTKKKALFAATQSIHAIGLRNSTAHVELMRTNDGWKVIELGARIGGFRHTLYGLTQNINHSLNDILIRIGEAPHVPKKQKGYAAVLKFFAKEEGELTALKGVKKIQKLDSFESIKVNRVVGETCLYAKNGGKSVCNIILFNKTRPELLADIRRIEKTIVIETKKKRSTVKKVVLT
jgi:biotin carboxylase